jgi:hypothetical protein
LIIAQRTAWIRAPSTETPDLAGHAQGDVHRQAAVVERPHLVFVPPTTWPRLATGTLPAPTVPHDLVRTHQLQLPRPHDSANIILDEEMASRMM